MPRRFPLPLSGLLFSLFALLPSPFHPLRAQNSESRISASDLLRVKTLADPAISPDGSQVVYTVRGLTPPTDGPRDAHSPTSQLWLVAIDGAGGPRALTPADSLASAPAWSPKGDRIAYLRAEPASGRSRLWVHPANGKGADFPVTPALLDLKPPHWSPDGTRLLFTARVTDAEVDAALALATKRASKKNPHPRPILKLFVPPDPIIPGPDGNQTQRRAWLAANVPLVLPQSAPPSTDHPSLEPKTYTHIFTVEAKPDKTPSDLTPERADYRQPDWSPDGRGIYCVGIDISKKLNGLCALSADGSALNPLPSPPATLLYSPTPSPDGRSVAFVAQPCFDDGPGTLDLLNISDGKITILTAKLGQTVRDPRWSPDGKFIYFTSVSNGGTLLYRVPPTGKNPSRLTAPDSGISGYAASADNLALVIAKASDPAELYASDPDGANQSILTMHNSEWLRYKNPANFEYHQLKRPDKTTVSYWLLRPPYFEGGMRYPLLLALHQNKHALQGPGGPPEDWLPLQFFASRGYAVVVCNDFGDDENTEDGTDYESPSGLGAKAYANLLAVIDDCTAKNTWIDPDREVVSSDGSWLAFWRLLADTRFKAAIVQDGIPPFAKEKSVRTPLFIVQSETAFPSETAKAQSFYEKLNALGRPVEYALYPRVASGGDRTYEATQDIDRLVREDDFFRRHIGDPAQPAPPPPKEPVAPATPKASTSTTAPTSTTPAPKP